MELFGKRQTSQKRTSVTSWRNRSLRWARFARRGRRSSFCAALPGERVVRSGGRKVLVLPIDLRVAATPYASCRNISIDPAGT